MEPNVDVVVTLDPDTYRALVARAVDRHTVASSEAATLIKRALEPVNAEEGSAASCLRPGVKITALLMPAEVRELEELREAAAADDEDIESMGDVLRWGALCTARLHRKQKAGVPAGTDGSRHYAVRLSADQHQRITGYLQRHRNLWGNDVVGFLKSAAEYALHREPLERHEPVTHYRITGQDVTLCGLNIHSENYVETCDHDGTLLSEHDGPMPGSCEVCYPRWLDLHRAKSNVIGSLPVEDAKVIQDGINRAIGDPALGAADLRAKVRQGDPLAQEVRAVNAKIEQRFQAAVGAGELPRSGQVWVNRPDLPEGGRWVDPEQVIGVPGGYCRPSEDPAVASEKNERTRDRWSRVMGSRHVEPGGQHHHDLIDTTAAQQITYLAEWIIDNIPGEPSRSEGAVPTAIRLIEGLRERAEVAQEQMLLACRERDEYALGEKPTPYSYVDTVPQIVVERGTKVTIIVTDPVIVRSKEN